MLVPNSPAVIPAPPMVPAIDSSRPAEFDKPTNLQRIIYIIAILTPFAGLITGIVMLWGRGFNWLYLGLFVGMYLLSALGVTVGYHRLFCHRAFETSGFVKFIFGVMGSMAVEGSILKWVSMHRCHHQHSDAHGDPHSPHHHGTGFVNMFRGLLHAHVGWMFRGDPKDLSRYVTDLVRDKAIRACSKTWGLWAVVGMLLPAALGGLITMSWMGVLMGFLWGGLARVFLIHHMTWSINSICHLWGTKPFRSHDESRNNFLFGVIGLGEGWHNNHHAFPTSARHGLRWWELDLSYSVIRSLETLGLAWDVRVPNSARVTAKLAS